MKPVFQRLTTDPEEGFAFKEIRSAGFDCPWHTHPECELILVLQGRGYRIVGDKFSRLGAGDLVLVGPGLPHIWQNTPDDPGQDSVHFLLIQFEERCLGDGLLKLPAMEPVRRLLRRAARGLHIVGRTQATVAALMRQMARVKGMERIVLFLQVVVELAGSEECAPLASPAFAANTNLYDQERMDRVFQFLNSQLERSVRLHEVARVVHLSEGAFSRFFRVHTGKTFPQFVNELRIGRACALLMEEDLNVTEVAYRSGFVNLSNFNRQFRRLRGVSPHEFRLQVRQRLH